MPTAQLAEPGIRIGLAELIDMRHRVREIQLFSRPGQRSPLVGLHHSKLRGRGVDFDQVRVYQAGDDVRNIDWRVTARLGRPHTRLYGEEQDQAHWLLLDLSPAMYFGSRCQLKARLGCELAAALLWQGEKQANTLICQGAAPHTAAPIVPRQAGDKPLASPAVRKRALDAGIELRYVHGSGPAGRILHEDLDGFMSKPQTAAGQAPSGYAKRTDSEQVQVIGLRRKIAQRMQDAKRRVAHFSYVEEIDVTALEALRQQLNQKHGDSRGKLTLLPFLVRALVVALRDFPQINATYDDEAGVLTQHAPVHLGIAAQTPNGLMVPVVRHAEARDPYDTALEIARVSGAAKDGSAKREELSGSTITITSLGTLGGITHTPIINHPEVAIVGPNKIAERVVVKDGQMVVRKMMNLSSSFDHRIVDRLDSAVALFVDAFDGIALGWADLAFDDDFVDLFQHPSL